MNIKKIIKEEIDGSLEWLKNIKPSLNDAFEQDVIKVGDVLTLSGKLLDEDAIEWKMVNDFKIKIVKLVKGTPEPSFRRVNSSYFIPLQKKYWKHLGYNGEDEIRFYGSDGDMKIEDHTRKH